MSTTVFRSHLSPVVPFVAYAHLVGSGEPDNAVDDVMSMRFESSITLEPLFASLELSI